jgi:hypothetical protein
VGGPGKAQDAPARAGEGRGPRFWDSSWRRWPRRASITCSSKKRLYVKYFTLQNALRGAQGRGEVPGSPIISVQERRRKGQRSLTNIIRIVSREWSDWLRKGPRRPAMGVGSNCTAAKKSSTTDTGLFLKGGADEPPPWGVPDGVYSCEEAI